MIKLFSRLNRLGLLTLLLAAGLCWPMAWAQDARQEEAEDYYQKWLEQDVQYIISEEEREVFNTLVTDEERDAFIEQFWFRRDPDPRTVLNEYKEEHYRRIAYVNEKFGSGIPGWKTDRGRTYITFGPPDSIEDHPSGGWYYRPHHEGGGATSTYPFQIWTYHNIDGVGDQIEIEFVDPSWSGEYRMALEPWEKDALLHAGFLGPTDAELEGSLSKLDRPYFNPGNYRNTRMQSRLGLRMRDKPFEKMVRFYQLQKPEPIEYFDLKQLVSTSVTYEQVPFKIGYQYLSVDEEAVLVPVTLEFENRDLTFKPASGEPALLRGQVNIYGLVQNLSGRIVEEFDDTLHMGFPAAEKEVRLGRKSVFQKMILLPPGRYKLTMAVKDDRSDRVGSQTLGLVLPGREEGLDASSVILARALQYRKDADPEIDPFLLGDFKVIPNVTATFNRGDQMGLYLQVYNAGVDGSTSQPEVDVEYQILHEGKVVMSLLDPKKNSVLNYGDRLVLLQAFDLKKLKPGDYKLRVKVADRIQATQLSREVPFSVTTS
ncbi:MAG TPA: GWxTD domain-containing protein [Acidobacteriota bacterium]|nr:GWxTD domain-containing protein [Acidobacteriota bacterium]